MGLRDASRPSPEKEIVSDHRPSPRSEIEFDLRFKLAIYKGLHEEKASGGSFTNALESM